MDEIEIILGTYENLLLGYRTEKLVDGGYTLESSFTTDSHRGALRCLAVSAQGVLVSSSTDDSIRLHSLKKRKEVGSLFQHDGSVNCIRFFKGGHMFSASEDGTICLWKCKSWELLRVLKGHRSHVMAVVVHPSGKLGLSVGSDRTFFTWDLTTGKLAFKRKTEQVAQDILFTQDGNNYVLVYQKKIEVCSLEDTSVVQEINFNCRINATCFVEDNLLAVGEDDGKVSIINVISNTQLLQTTLKSRVRSLCSLSTKIGLLLFIATSNGVLKLCKLDFTEGSESVETVIEYETKVRVTCMAAYGPPEILKPEEAIEEVRVKGKRKRKRQYEDNEVDDGQDNNDTLEDELQEDNDDDDDKNNDEAVEDDEDNDELQEDDDDDDDEDDNDETVEDDVENDDDNHDDDDDQENDLQEESNDDVSEEEPVEEMKKKTSVTKSSKKETKKRKAVQLSPDGDRKSKMRKEKSSKNQKKLNKSEELRPKKKKKVK